MIQALLQVDPVRALAFAFGLLLGLAFIMLFALACYMGVEGYDEGLMGLNEERREREQ